MAMVCWFSSFWHHFHLVKWVKFGVSGHFPEDSWRQWPEILHVDVSRSPSELFKSKSWSVDFLILALFWLSEMGQIWGFQAFSGEHMVGMVWNFACWCILTTFRTEEIMVMVCLFSSFWHHFDLVKQVQFGVSRHFPENAWREWL